MLQRPSQPIGVSWALHVARLTLEARGFGLIAFPLWQTLRQL